MPINHQEIYTQVKEIGKGAKERRCAKRLGSFWTGRLARYAGATAAERGSSAVGLGPADATAREAT